MREARKLGLPSRSLLSLLAFGEKQLAPLFWSPFCILANDTTMIKTCFQPDQSNRASTQKSMKT